MKLRNILAAFALGAAILTPAAAIAAKTTPSPSPTPYPYSGEYGGFEEVSRNISELYIEPYTKEEVMAQGLSELLRNNSPLLVELLKSTLESMDDYSEFYTEEEYKQFLQQLNRTFYGIGILMKEREDGYVEVNGFADGTDNAVKAGFEVGDIIVKVNGKDVTGQRLSSIREQVVGEEGTTVNVTVMRNGQEIELTAKRVAVNATTVSSGILSGNIGYISIVSFSADTAAEFEKALEDMRGNDVKKIILDLRNNGGGLVQAAIQIAQDIVPSGKIIDVVYRNEDDNQTYTSDLKKSEFDFKVLVNEHTASASEILASALQDSKAGELIGTKTYGKAVIQNTFPLKNGSVFKLTTGKYITRNGNEINKIGLVPDIQVENVVDKLKTTAYTQFDYSTRSSLGQTNGNVKAAKERLSILGLYSGEENDVYDTGLYEAVKTFQQTNELFAYGVIDIPTQKLLEEKVTEIDVTDDRQLKTAYERLGGKVEELYN